MQEAEIAVDSLEEEIEDDEAHEMEDTLHDENGSQTKITQQKNEKRWIVENGFHEKNISHRGKNEDHEEMEDSQDDEAMLHDDLGFHKKNSTRCEANEDHEKVVLAHEAMTEVHEKNGSHKKNSTR